ncbi:MAG: class B sortase [Coriobacteriia bacterium]|nr:class B sortase [Coriobacteriia bacterium]
MSIEYRRTEKPPLPSRATRKKKTDQAEKDTQRSVARAEMAEAREEAKKNAPKKRNWVSLLLLLLGLSLMGYALWQLGTIAWKYYSADRVYSAITEEFAPPVEEVVDDYEATLDAARKRIIDFEGLRSMNPDIVAWIFIPGTRIDYPVAHTDNNDFYLNHDFEGNPSDGGSIFLETLNSPDFTDMDSRIYGHNMFDGSMFGQLPRYRKPDFAQYYTNLFLYTPNETIEYRLIDQGLIAPDQLHPVESDNPNDRFLTLVTCEYDFDDARFFIRVNRIARFLPGGEPLGEALPNEIPTSGTE